MHPFTKAVLWVVCLVPASGHSAKESPDFSKEGEPYVYANLKKGDSRKVVLSKLREGGFLQIYEEREKGLVRCALQWGGLRYQLVCRIVDDELILCLVEGQRGWQDFFYEDVVRPQWTELREKLQSRYGENRLQAPFPGIDEVPLDDMGGFVTDKWELSDRWMILTVQTFREKDCCTEQMLQYSCCTLLIQPK